jgi:uncharacterized protein YndB with AHSA1/START domain/uncharacterized damage-inducible protein DinB
VTDATNAANATEAPVKKSVAVKASAEHAFKVFTEGFDTWWPRSHHIGKQPLVKAVIEPRAGGRCFGREADGTECPWGQVLTWDPPRRLVIAWQIDPTWQYEPDLAKASEVEVLFTTEPGGITRVDLEHRYFERHGAGFESIRTGVDAPNGWSGLLHFYAVKATSYHPAVAPLALIFSVNDSLASRSFEKLTDDDLWRRPTEKSNPMLWIFGHMVNTRAQMLKIFGESFDTGWGDVFDRGASLGGADTYPTREKVQAVSRDVNSRLYARLGGLTEADLAKSATRSPTPAIKTIADQIAFLVMHDTYHVGQLAYVRKAIGHAGVAG